jgi:hypothetical protein
VSQMSHPAVRNAFADLNVSKEGLCYGDPDLRPLYLAHIYRGDRHEWALSAGRTQSTCILHVRGGLLECGTPGDDLNDPYEQHDRMVGSIVHQTAKRLDAWFDTSTRVGLEAYLSEANAGGFNTADCLWIGQEKQVRGIWGPDPDYGGGSHMLALVDQFQAELVDAAGHPLRQIDVQVSIDGGQGDELNAGRPTAILRRYRWAERVSNQVWLRDLAKVGDDWTQVRQVKAGRRLWGVLDPTRIEAVRAWAARQN